MINIYQQDAMTTLSNLKDKSIDLIITDPPYESLEKHRRQGTTTRLKVSQASSNPWFEVFPNSKFKELFEEFYRVLNNNRHFYLFCDQETAFIAKPIAESVGFKFWKPLIWDKKKIGMGYHYRSRYEFILFFEKGKRKLSNLGTPDILEFSRIKNGYPTEKPVEVSQVLVGQSSLEGEVVLDPFMGSGSVGLAAKNLNRSFIGSDISQVSYNLVINRLGLV